MNEDFKKKWEAYQNGELSDKEQEELEKEIEKLEQYMELLDGDQEKEKSSKSIIPYKKQTKMIKYSKWKARIQTAFTAIGIFLLFTIISSIFTAIYYSWGNPDRVDVYRNIIDYTLTVTNPYGELGATSTGTNAFFKLESSRDLKKRIGTEIVKVGELRTNFIFSMMGVPEEEWTGDGSLYQPYFTFPATNEMSNGESWNTLEKLPEGTVLSAYLSFSRLMETDEVLQRFEGKDMDLVWLAVDTGTEKQEDIALSPIGFPSNPIWHDDDMVLDSREEEKGLFGTRIISEGYSSPEYVEGDQEILQNQFLKTLAFLQKYEKKADKLYSSDLNLSERIEYLEKNGFKHYGVVITGPTKEILKLQNEDWAGDIEIDEVRFWNWN